MAVELVPSHLVQASIDLSPAYGTTMRREEEEPLLRQLAGQFGERLLEGKHIKVEVAAHRGSFYQATGYLLRAYVLRPDERDELLERLHMTETAAGCRQLVLQYLS